MTSVPVIMVPVVAVVPTAAEADKPHSPARDAPKPPSAQRRRGLVAALVLAAMLALGLGVGLGVGLAAKSGGPVAAPVATRDAKSAESPTHCRYGDDVAHCPVMTWHMARGGAGVDVLLAPRV